MIAPRANEERAMALWGIILAAGSARRLLGAGLPCAKQFLLFKDKPLYWHGARAMAKVPELEGIVFVLPPGMGEEEFRQREEEVKKLFFQENISLQWKVVPGGASRQESVGTGLEALPAGAHAVLVHDSARPFASPRLMASVAQALHSCDAVIPAIPVTDTIKQVNKLSYVVHTPDRETLQAVQTPQGFTVALLRQAHAKALENGICVTDDAMLMEQAGIGVLVIPGEVGNVKITHPEDLDMLEAKSAMAKNLYVTGFGYDVHQYGGSRPFILGGLPLQTDIMIKAHSDGDVLLHALCDAILGCVGGKAGDIGTLFPDSDPQYDNYPGGALLSDVLNLASRHGVQIVHADLTVIAQVPKIAPHRYGIAKNIASLLKIPVESVSVKATTEEKMGFTGEKKGIKAVAVVSAIKTMP